MIDNVWDTDASASLRKAFPNNKSGIRVIVTTSNNVVAKRSDKETYVYELPLLKYEESWALFCKKAFPRYDKVGDSTSVALQTSRHWQEVWYANVMVFPVP